MFIEQMVCTNLKPFPLVPIVQLQQADVPAMMALTSVTEPGPFLSETIRMGRYYGIKSDDGQLLAMAGERLRMDGFTEISAVCTDPDFRGRGYAGALVTFLATLISNERKIPFLHVKTTNEAKKLYQKLGFTIRTEIRLTMFAIP
jgi:predicted GNAT family acetyltransferase